VLSATNADLQAEVRANRFRQDLLFRLNTVEIGIPPLRERPEDIAPLAEHFLHQYASRYRKTFTGFEPMVFSALRAHPFPGNVRELDHVIERAVLMARGDVIQPSDLCLPAAGREVSGRMEEMSLEEVEKLLINKALARAGGNVNLAAEALGLSRSALYRRIARYDIG
jgi:DNA-binding NtrC family response regulator